jgi:protein tyrosine phosphatase (PTP) superfamily phosphohydrolase (DUF442 family)
MKMIILALIFSFILGGCAHHVSEVKPSIQITKDLKGHNYGTIYFSTQPKEQDFAALKENGFAAIINLREKKEKDYSESWERNLVKKQELAYYNIPFSMKNEMTDSYVDSVTTKIKKHLKSGKVLVHCSSGNRVGIWIGAHFLKDHNYSKEKSMDIAKELGLSKKMAQDKLQSYLDKK